MANNSKVALLCAYTLASAGRYDDAEALILTDVEVSRTSEAMDLLARIRVEQGDRAEARRLWQEVQLRDPNHAPSRIALKNLDRAPSRFSCRTKWWASLAAAAIGGIVIGAWLLGGPSAPDTVQVRWEQMATTADLTALQAYQGTVDRIVVSSNFFDQSKNVAQRSVLKELLCSALGLAQEEVLMGAARPDAPAEAIDLELILKTE